MTIYPHSAKAERGRIETSSVQTLIVTYGLQVKGKVLHSGGKALQCLIHACNVNAVSFILLVLSPQSALPESPFYRVWHVPMSHDLKVQLVICNT